MESLNLFKLDWAQGNSRNSGSWQKLPKRQPLEDIKTDQGPGASLGQKGDSRTGRAEPQIDGDNIPAYYTPQFSFI